MTPLEEAQAAKDVMMEERRRKRQSMSKAEFKAWNEDRRRDHRAISDRLDDLTIHGLGQVVGVGPMGETNESI